MNPLRLLHLIVLILIEAGVLQSRILMSLNVSCCNIPSWTLTREAILSLRPASPKLDLSTRLNIAALGCAGRRRGQRGGRAKRTCAESQEIPVIIGNRPKSKLCLKQRQSVERQQTVATSNRADGTCRCLQPVRRTMSTRASPRHDAADEPVLSLYVVNAAALCKPHALQHLSADLNSYRTPLTSLSCQRRTLRPSTLTVS